MFFGLSDATNAYEKAQDRRKETRKENARLYNEFVRLNPGATTQERLDFANNLIKETGAGSAGLPTKAQMESNYNKYKDAEAKKAAAEAERRKEKERQRKIANLKLADELGARAASLWGDANFEDALKTQFEEFGIDPTNLPSATKVAENAAWTQWKQENAAIIDAYSKNPTKANLEALNTAAGTLWGGKVANTYGGMHTSWIDQNKLTFADELEQLATSAKDMATYNRGLERLKAKYPPEVYAGLDFTTNKDVITDRRTAEYDDELNRLADANLTYDQFIRRKQELDESFDINVRKGSSIDDPTEIVLNRRRQMAQAEIEALSGITDQDEYNRRKAAILEKYSQGVPNFADMDTQIANNITEKNKLATLNAEQQVMSLAASASTKEDYELLKSQVLANLPEGVDASAVTTKADILFARKMEELAEKDAQADLQAAQNAVNNSQQQVKDAVNGAMTADQVIAEMERNLTVQQGRPVKLDEKQANAVRDKFTTQQTALTAQLENILENILESENGTVALSETRDEFVRSFLKDLTAEGIKITDAHEQMAQAHFDNTVTQIRETANKREEEQIRLVQTEMEAGGAIRGSGIQMKELVDYTKDVLSNSEVFKGVDPEQVGPGVIGQLGTHLESIAAELNIPMSQQMAEEVVNALSNMASASEQEIFLENGRLPKTMVQQALTYVLGRNGDDAFVGNKHSQLETIAMEEALAKMKLNGFGDVIQNPELYEQFRQEYAKARAEVRRETYDVLRGSNVSDDIAPAQNALTIGSSAVEGYTPAVEKVNTVLQMDAIELYQATTGGVDGAAAEIDATFTEGASSLITSLNAIQSEKNRLALLLKSQVYNENFASDRQKINDLLVRLTESEKQVDAALTQLQNQKQRVNDRIAQGKVMYEARRNALIAEQQAEQEAALRAENARNKVGGSSSKTRLTPTQVQENNQSTLETLGSLLPWNWDVGNPEDRKSITETRGSRRD